MPPVDLLFLDEAGSHIAMTREHVRCPRGERFFERVPRNRGTVQTILGALTLDGMQAICSFQGGTTGARFLAWVREDLCPLLRVGSVVVMDNLGAHHATGVREAIEAVGARVIYLPPYSPDLNPIEECWSKLKSVLRMLGARTAAALRGAISDAAATINPSDAAGWFRHAGYQARCG